MTTHDPQAIIQALHDQARPTLLQYMTRDSCIPSTRIGIDVLAYFGIHAEPLPLFVLVINQDGVEMLNEGDKTLDDVGREALKRQASDPGGPWTIGLGAPLEARSGAGAAPGKWAGHLVIAVPERRTLIDLSVDQINRPLKGIMFKDPLVIELDESSDPWWTGEVGHYPVLITDDEGHQIGMVLDRANCPDPDGYKATKNWHRQSAAGTLPFSAITGRIIRNMKHQLEEDS